MKEKILTKAGKSMDFRSRSFENLTAKRQEVEETLSRLMARQEEYKDLRSSDALIEEADHAEREISAHTYYSILERKNEELKKIDLLVCRLLEDEEFGFCEECGEPIPEERLLIVPEAACCVPCQRELEKCNLRESLSEMSNASSRRNNSAGWGHRQGFNDEDNFSFSSVLEQISSVDLGEIEIEESKALENV